MEVEFNNPIENDTNNLDIVESEEKINEIIVDHEIFL